MARRAARGRIVVAMVAVGARGVMDAVVVVVVVARTGVAQQSRHASHSRGSQPHLVSRRGLALAPSGGPFPLSPSPPWHAHSASSFARQGMCVAILSLARGWGRIGRILATLGCRQANTANRASSRQGGELLAVDRMPLLRKQKVIREPSVDLQVAPNQRQGTATSGGATSSDERWDGPTLRRMTGPSLDLQILKLGMPACIIISFAEATVAAPCCGTRCAAPLIEEGRDVAVDLIKNSLVLRARSRLMGRKAWSGKLPTAAHELSAH